MLIVISTIINNMPFYTRTDYKNPEVFIIIIFVIIVIVVLLLLLLLLGDYYCRGSKKYMW